MGFFVSTLNNLPAAKLRWFIYVIDVSGSGTHSRWINADLATLGASIGPDTGLVTGPGQLSQELFNFLQNSLEPEAFGHVERLLRETTCILLSEDRLIDTRRPVYLFPVATKDETDSSRDFVSTLIREIATRLNTCPPSEIVAQLGACTPLQLKHTGSRMIVCTMRTLNEALILKPCTAPGFLDTRLRYAAWRSSYSSRASSGVRYASFSRRQHWL